MAQPIASMAGLRGSSQAVLEGSLQLSGSTRLNASCISGIGLITRPTGFSVRAHQTSHEHETSRRAVLGLVAAGFASGSLVQAVLAEAKPSSLVQAVLAEAKPIKIGPPPPPSGGLAGTLNSDEPRDLELPLNERFFIQPLPPAEAAKRAKESAQEILNVKQQIDKKAWPYVQNDLRLRASYLRYDLKTFISAKPKDEKKELKELTKKLFDNISELDHAAKIKSSSDAEKYYAATVSSLNDVLSKLA